jgi:hypothetical protein
MEKITVRIFEKLKAIALIYIWLCIELHPSRSQQPANSIEIAHRNGDMSHPG